jgi:peptidoglycan/xylan/chitin deacetylase (PgdA/CDA1 family)
MRATSTERPSIRSVSQQREVVLSFDDGPYPVNTPKVLDVLAKRGIRAVFFLSGDTRHFETADNGLIARQSDEQILRKT